MIFRTLRFRLTLWYALTLAVILAASAFSWHWSLSRTLLSHIDEKLSLVAQDVVAFHLVDQHPTHPTGLCLDLEAFSREHNWGEFIQVVDPHGGACLTSNLQGQELPLGEKTLQAVRRGEPHFETVRGFGLGPVRVMTFPVSTQNGVRQLVQAGSGLSDMEHALNENLWILMVFCPFALALLSVWGWFLAGKALAPVDRVTRKVREINAENLSQRLPIPPAKGQDEISRLVETFNSMLARLEESFNKIRQFSGDASHELRTPLAILKGETEVSLRWGKGEDELRRTLVSNLEEIERMERIIEDLLTLAKSEAGETSLEITEFSLSDMLQDMYIMGRALAEPKNIHLTLNLQVKKEIFIHADQLQLHRVFLNLVSNAVKYTLAGGNVRLSLEICGDEAVVAVKDTGIGMAQRHLEHIFDRFYRVDEARNREVGGTGLGLAIVKWIVRSHGGRIEVRSNEGEGSVFTVCLPLHGPPPEVEALEPGE